jgi:chromosomal replication initiator protein
VAGEGVGLSSALIAGLVLGPENQMTHVALEAILGGGDHLFNPVVFHGPSGVGKSHLATGLVAAWKKRFRQRPAIYLPALDFARELADAFDAHAVDDFRERHGRAWLLVLDDLQLLAPRQAAQREVASLLDASLECGKRVVLTCSTAPEHLEGFLPSLLGRLVSGLCIQMVLPGVDTRRLLLDQFARQHEIPLDASVACLLARGLGTPAPGLCRALMELHVAANMVGEGITPQRAREYLAARAAPRRATLSQIARLTARHFSLKVADLRSASRRRAVVRARDVAMYLARTLTRSSLKEIGTYFDGRDHSTVSYGCWKTEKLLEADPAIHDAVRTLRRCLERDGSMHNACSKPGKTC